MAWSDGYVALDCGHKIGIERWDSTFVGDDVRCPQCKATRQVERMSRIYEARPSRDFSLGVTDVPDGLAGATEGGPPAP
jgi:DNA-directed RNA polymerase subunit RPC12/RpoP